MTDLAVGLSERHLAALITVADGLRDVQAELDRVQAARVRLLADAERLAVDLAAGSDRSTKERDMARRAVASEIAVRLRLSDRSVQARMSEALTLVDDYPVVMAAWEAGRIREQHVRAVVDAGRMLPADARRRLDAAAVVACERLSTVQAKAELEHVAERLHPRSTTERHGGARAGRRVWVDVLGDGDVTTHRRPALGPGRGDPREAHPAGGGAGGHARAGERAGTRGGRHGRLR